MENKREVKYENEEDREEEFRPHKTHKSKHSNAHYADHSEYILSFDSICICRPSKPSRLVNDFHVAQKAIVDAVVMEDHIKGSKHSSLVQNGGLNVAQNQHSGYLKSISDNGYPFVFKEGRAVSDFFEVGVKHQESKYEDNKH